MIIAFLVHTVLNKSTISGGGDGKEVEEKEEEKLKEFNDRIRAFLVKSCRSTLIAL